MVAASGPGSVWLRLDRDLKDPHKLLLQLGLILQKQAVDAFRLQGLPGLPWKARSVPNVAGAVQDLSKGPKIKSRRWDARPAGIDTSSLLRSLSSRSEAIRPFGLWEVHVGSRLPHAADMQYGGSSLVHIDQTIRDNLATVLRGQRKKRDRLARFAGTPVERLTARLEDARLRLLRKRMGWLFQYAVVTFRVPPRPFLDVTDDAMGKMMAAVQRFYRIGGQGGTGSPINSPVG